MGRPATRVRRFGAHAILVEVSGSDEALDLAAWVRRRDLDVADVVPAATTVLLDGVAEVDRVVAELEHWRPGAGPPRGDVVELPVRYDGPDLGFVAEHWGLDLQQAVRRHAAGEYVVAFCGFAPGFAYLTGLAEEHAVPRLEQPRTRVAPGAVGLAGSFTGVYPQASPGGWRIVGHTDRVLWDPDRRPPALLEPGTRVRFVEAS